MKNNKIKNIIGQWLIIITLLSLFTLPAQAAIPDDLDYQGYLTDNTGSPINSTVSVTFSLYNVGLNGVPLWSNTQTVTVSKGLFTVKLGGAGSPFPLGLFDAPLWLSLNVASDGEMSPRIALSSAAFAHKADDALTLDGISPGTLDQSAHVTNTGNPHSVTAAQTGAADVATLGLHIGNTANPHSVTAAQTGAASSANFATHTSNVSAHHSRFSGIEAVVAMGSTSNSNALNHIKYSNTNAVAAIKAADGAGSTLDADLLDGLQANEIISAAQDEVRTPISSLPFTISTPGSYYVTANLDGSAGGINITSSDVTLDLMGFTLDGGGAINDNGINLTGQSNVTIKNGSIRAFGAAGIYQISNTANYNKVVDVQVLGNGLALLNIGKITSGISLAGSRNHVERCIAADNRGDGIYAGQGSTIIDNTVNNGNGDGVYGGTGSIITGNTSYNIQGSGIVGGTSSIITGNTAYRIRGGDGIVGGVGSTITGNTAYNIQDRDGIVGGTGSTITGNTVFSSQGSGIVGGSGSTITGNTVNSNNGNGIFSAGTSTIIGNTAYNNKSNGVRCGVGSIITGNMAFNNQGWGISAAGSSIIKDNTISRNNLSAIAGQGGLRVINNSRVVGNTLDGNGLNNIYVSSGGNVIKDNHVTGSTNGVFFRISGSYYRDNTASGNTTNFNLGSTTQTNGGGNASF